jgi:hypothetical protein
MGDWVVMTTSSKLTERALEPLGSNHLIMVGTEDQDQIGSR